jgi:hypothetical protein
LLRVFGALTFLVVVQLLASSNLALAQTLPPCDDHTAEAASTPTVKLLRDEDDDSIQIAFADKNKGEGSALLGAKPIDEADQDSSPVAGAEVAAEIAKQPKDGAVVVAGFTVGAAANHAGNAVRVHVCRIAAGGSVDPGQYTGSVSIYGPTIEPFEMPLVVTAKQPWYWAAVILTGTALATFLLALFTRSLPALKYGPGKKVRAIISVIVALAVVGIADALTYFGTYDINATWGANAKEDYLAVGVAGATAAAAALAGYARVLGRPR